MRFGTEERLEQSRFLYQRSRTYIAAEDSAHARAYLVRAAEADYAQAQYELAMTLTESTGGVESGCKARELLAAAAREPNFQAKVAFAQAWQENSFAQCPVLAAQSEVARIIAEARDLAMTPAEQDRERHSRQVCGRLNPDCGRIPG